MPQPNNFLRIVGAENAGDSTRVFEIERTSGDPFESIGGKYIIVHTGVALPDGKPVKRAYSLLPVPGTKSRCRLVVKRLGEGPGSNALHAAPLGTELSFSGPWGKLVPREGLEEGALFLATDTGITSALSVVEYASSARQRLPLGVLWLRASDETFLDVDQVRSRVEESGTRFFHAVIPPARSAGRLEMARGHVDAWIAESGARVLLSAGDGAVIHPLKERFLSEGGAIREVRIESFFHNPERKA